MKIEKFDFKDIREIVRMINDVWNLEEMHHNVQAGIDFSKLYFLDVLRSASDVYVIREETISGFLVLNMLNKRRLEIPEMALNYLTTYENDQYLDQDRRRMKEYKEHCHSLLKISKQDFDGEIVLFVVDSSQQHRGMGKKLFNLAKEKFKEENCQNYYLYTDTNCDYTFYDHNNMICLAQLELEKKFKLFLYGGKI